MIEYVGELAWVYRQPPGGWVLNNSGIVGGSTPVLVDTCATNRRTEYLLLHARERVGELGACVSTHHHPDHTYGNHLLPDGLPIWASAQARTAAESIGLQYYDVMLTDADWGEQTLRLATDVVDATPTKVGDVVAQQFPGERAHTTGDVVAWVPRAGVLYAGDLVFAGVTPFLLDASVQGWLEAIEWLRTFDAETLVPGHGPVARDPKRALDDMTAYLELVLTAAKSGNDPVDAAKGLRDTKFGAWETAADRDIVAVTVAMRELRGEPIDPGQAIAPMLRHRGAPISCCGV